jgi:hypothetical protein
MLEKEYKYFESIANELAKENPHKFAVIKGEKVIGIYDTIQDALKETAKENELGTFIIQQCEDKRHLMQKFHSRAAFA